MSKRTLSPSTSSRQTRAFTTAILPDVDPKLLMRQTKRMRISSQASIPLQPSLVDASQRALDTIKDRYQSGSSLTQPSPLPPLDDQHDFDQYLDFEGGAGPSATGKNPSPAKFVESENGTIVENPNSPGNKPANPPAEASDELVEVPNELGDIFHAPRKVPINDELVKLLTARKDSKIATLWSSMTFSSLDRLAPGWRLCNKNSAVVRLEGELCTGCQRHLDGGEDFCVGCIGPLGGVCGECSAKGTLKCWVKHSNPKPKFRVVSFFFLQT
ncbi:hypothetical protein TREMEDRAFT_66402 [Tremella mesenterica DSM 1558]|uniref:uncharacterized protein n=1 Tax=Tremella mesenterica (strain ATCC 24925 / CBS 8224 / DSM 1558 / NBRC 9311 / NRRL Y-6157 / RJB 2259-6 / UBC 559-6) TaxID=578456 RepID=UPI00032C39AF|nr:uncharacterized protein TREMEDRAFT_66402 [Tremella mesenterica DSM 1558]EIW65575.1 hypothetical protein TREMEDRAFT_66402 [Tremella mesenterica DSM 1558]